MVKINYEPNWANLVLAFQNHQSFPFTYLNLPLKTNSKQTESIL